MKRKQLDVHGQVVEVDGADASPPETAVTPLRPLTVEARVPEPEGSAWTNLIANLTALHILAARFIRRRVLLMADLEQREAHEMRSVMRHVALQLNGEAKMIREVRTRLVWHERHIPLLAESRRRWDAQMRIRNEQKARAADENREGGKQ